MGKMNTAERVSREMSDNFVFQRSLLAYHAAAQRIGEQAGPQEREKSTDFHGRKVGFVCES